MKMNLNYLYNDMFFNIHNIFWLYEEYSIISKITNLNLPYNKGLQNYRAVMDTQCDVNIDHSYIFFDTEPCSCTYDSLFIDR